MPKMIFVNLPVKDLAAATRFYKAIGCAKNERFSSDQVSSMVLPDTVTEAAAVAGGRADIRDRQDMSFMYARAFEDLEGHVFEPVWKDVEAALATAGAQQAESA